MAEKTKQSSDICVRKDLCNSSSHEDKDIGVVVLLVRCAFQ